MSKALDGVLTVLPSLSQKELATIKAVVEQLYKPVYSQGVDPTTLVFDALMKAINTKMAFRDFQRTSVYKLWRQHAPACIEFVEETFPTVKRSQVTKMAVLRFLLEALRDNLKAGQIPVTVGTMVTHLGRIPQVFETSFPDYRESGMTDLVLKAMQRGASSLTTEAKEKL